MNKSFLDNKTTTYKEQYYRDGRSYGKTFFQNRIRQAYKSGLDDGFIEKHRLIKYLEDMIKWTTEKAHLEEDYQEHWTETKKIAWWLVQERKEILEKVKSDKYE